MHDNLETFEVWQPSQGESRGDNKVIRALDEQDAAEQYAERDDYESYAIANGEEAVVHVVHVHAPLVAPPKVFRVTAEARPLYTAEETDDA